MANLLNISDQEFELAEKFFNNNPSQIKMDRKEAASAGSYSFIKIKDEIYAIANQEYFGDSALLGEGAFSKVKLVQSKSGENFAVKIEGREPRDENNAELKVMQILGKMKGQAARNLEQEKEYKDKATDKKLYTLLKLEEGQELYTATYEKDDGALNPNLLLMALLNSAKEIEAIHEQGIIHADIKEQNFMANANDEQILIAAVDFGFAKILTPGENEVHSPYLQGTLEYMAPEIINATNNDHRYSPASDMYAFGKMVEFMVVFPKNQLEYFSRQLTKLQNTPINERDQDHDTDLQNLQDAVDYYQVLTDLYASDISKELGNLPSEMTAHQPNDRPTFKEAISKISQALEKTFPSLDAASKKAAQKAIEEIKPFFALDNIFKQKLSEQINQEKSATTHPTQQMFSSYQHSSHTVEFTSEKQRSQALAKADNIIDKLKNARMPHVEKATIAYGALIQLKEAIQDNPSPASNQLKKLCDEKMAAIEKAYPAKDVQKDALSKVQAFAQPLDKKPTPAPR